MPPFRLLLSCAFLAIFLPLQAQKGALTQVKSQGLRATEGDPVSTLDSLLANGQSAELYQALGNAYYDRREYGRSILAYERGLRLSPGNAALNNNLRFVRGEMAIDRPEVKEFFLVRWWRSLGALLGVRASLWIALVFWALAVAGATFWYLRRHQLTETRRFALLPTAGLMLFLAALFYLLGLSREDYLTYDKEAILVARQAELRVAPGADATLEDQLNEGIKLRVLDTFDDYVKVGLVSGRQGWLPRDAVEVI